MYNDYSLKQSFKNEVVMDPFETVLTMVRMGEHAQELAKLSSGLMQEPDFKTDSRLQEKHRVMLKAIDEFEKALANKV